MGFIESMAGRNRSLSQALLVAFVLFFGAAPARVETLSTERIIVSFPPGHLTKEPVSASGVVRVQTQAGQKSITELHGVIRIENIVPRGWAAHSVDGPYVCEIITPEDLAAYVMAASSSSDVDAVEATDVLSSPVLGENTWQWYPGTDQPRFCDQKQLHRRVEGDVRHPDDWCGLEYSPEIGDNDLDLPQAWGVTRGSPDVVVGVIDGGLAWWLPDLGGTGPPVPVSAADSLGYYLDGVLVSTTSDPPGDVSGDGRPGLSGVDDDGDGKRDEDSKDYDMENKAEPDVWYSVAESVVGNVLTDNAANFVPGEFAGGDHVLYIDQGRNDRAFVYIVGNTEKTIEVAPLEGVVPLESLVLAGDHYRVGDQLDNDGSDEGMWWDDNDPDDIGWENDLPNDDDESGAEDDIHGYDFVGWFSAIGPNSFSYEYTVYPNEDYDTPDNDTFSHAEHGSAVAAQVASSSVHGDMMGVAPGVKILPVRALAAGLRLSDGTPQVAAYHPEDLIRAIAYCQEMGVDVISTSINFQSMSGNMHVAAAFQKAVDSGIVWINGAGNEYYDFEPFMSQHVSPSVFVAGLDDFGEGWDERSPISNRGTAHGDWVDISAPWLNIVPLVNPNLPRDQGGYSTQGGTSLSGPLVAGVAALVKSAYPHYSRDEIIAKLLGSVDDIYSNEMNPDLQGALGSGRVNAYKAVTFYGDVITAGSDTTWSEEIWIGGDILVSPGELLTVSGGVTVYVASDDLLSAGLDPDAVEFDIQGELRIDGAWNAPVTFELFDGSGTQWKIYESIILTDEVSTVGEIGTVAANANAFLKPNDSTETQVFAVEISGVDGAETVEADLSGLGLIGEVLPLRDDGLGRDLLAADGIYTSDSFDVSLSGGTSHVVGVTVSGADGISSRKSVVVEVPDLVAALKDVSSNTGLAYSGVPYAGVSIDLDGAGESDLVISINELDNSGAGTYSSLHPSGAPVFSYAGVLEGAGARGLASADYDNDGDEDLFLAHASTPKLYRNDFGVLTDATPALFASDASSSTAACWGDYDGDGWLDLFVVRSDPAPSGAEPPGLHNISYKQHRLFRNELGIGGGFADVTSSTGISANTNGSVAASWGDIDQDGDLDLVVLNLSDPPLGETLLFVNQGNGTFVEQGQTRLERRAWQGDPILYGNGVVWADMNNDGDLDLVYSTALAGSSVWLNDGTGHFGVDDRILLPVVAHEISGLEVFDHDLDGRQDILLVSSDQSIPSRLLIGRVQANELRFVESTHYTELLLSDNALGSISTDFTADGDVDLFLGRPISSGEYFYISEKQSGSASLGRRYVKVRLESPAADNVNHAGIGATVEVSAGSLVQAQMVDGGSGRGGQKGRTLVFGLGDYSSDIVTATVRWPGGLVQPDVALVVSGGASGDVVNVISDVDPVLSNVKAEMLIDPGTGQIDWRFSWNTSAATTIDGDVVYVDQQGLSTPCLPGWTNVTAANAVHSYTFDADDGYKHTLTIEDWGCTQFCGFRFASESDSGLSPSTSAYSLKTVRFCPAQF